MTLNDLEIFLLGLDQPLEQKLKAKPIFLDTSLIPAGAPWLEIIYFRATIKFRRLDREQSSKKQILWDSISEKVANLVTLDLPSGVL